ncbi:hypothetical protein SAMN05216474_0934 [Lishizhenia tianjinensis]|uniref:CDP-Glycerol:Poly(Glycerophosphate) glycerophosphotransferase n=1 Tax=Lishizhenia tianjinensis TaxID=477690 RepID=A0A1I6YJB0_9FLAO|nr:hypothetical protein [Lishizhenia tianjinensis]SFT50424.1 hypothetical protein SAMN05216474_0934 [Lishizhenia tianjinensis]
MSEKINYQTFQEVIDFYNKTEQVFLDVENKLGVNLWFLENFRVYFAYRNSKLNSSSTSGSSGNKISLLTELKALIQNFTLKHHTSEIAIFAYPSSVRRYFGDLVDSFDLIGMRRIFQESVNLKEGSINQNTDAIFLRYLISFGFIKDVIYFNRHFTKLSKQLQNLSTTADEQLITSIFCKSKSTLLLHFLYFRAYCKFFKKSSLKAVCLINENSPSLKVIQYAIKKYGIKSFAVQHGSIHELHPSYMFGLYHTPPILPDMTFVWGQRDKTLLITKGGYVSSSVEIVGRIDGEVTPEIQHPELDLTKKIIVFATQPQRDEELRKKTFYDVASTFEDFIDEYQLVIRPHPNEKDDTFFKDIYDGNYLIDRVTPLKKHFELCEGIITSFSTVGVEFVPYYKKMLILDYYMQDVMKYIEKGVGIQILNKDMLKHNLECWEEIQVDRKAQEMYVNETLYQIDSSSQLKLINKIIENRLK